MTSTYAISCTREGAISLNFPELKEAGESASIPLINTESVCSSGTAKFILLRDVCNNNLEYYCSLERISAIGLKLAERLSTTPLEKRLSEIEVYVRDLSNRFHLAKQACGNIFAKDADWKVSLWKTIVYLENHPVSLAAGQSEKIKRSKNLGDRTLRWSILRTQQSVYILFKEEISKNQKVIKRTLDLKTFRVFIITKENRKSTQQNVHILWNSESETYQEIITAQKLGKNVTGLMVPHEMVSYTNEKKEIRERIVLPERIDLWYFLRNNSSLTNQQRELLAINVVKAIIKFKEITGRNHRDLKLENFLVLPDLSVELIDFAYSKSCIANGSGMLPCIRPNTESMRSIESWIAGNLIYSIIANLKRLSFQTLISNNQEHGLDLYHFHTTKFNISFENVIKRLMKEDPLERVPVTEALAMMEEQYNKMNSTK